MLIMLYLEDYVELIEHLPIDLQEKLTDMREMDLQIQTSVETLNGKTKELFEKCAAKKGKFSGADQAYEGIRSDYYKVLENADEKVQLANQIYDLVDRHLRKLDQELSKFKMELEADNAGITEILEQRSLELDNPMTLQRGSGRERRKAHAASTSSASTSASTTTNNGDGSVPEKRLKLDATSESELKTVQSMPQLHGSNSALSDKSFTPVFEVDTATSASLPVVSDVSSSTAEQSTTPSSSVYEPELSVSAQEVISRRSVSTKTGYDTPRSSDLAQRLSEIDQLSVESLDTSVDMISDSSLGSFLGGSIHRPSRTKKQTSKAAAWVQQRLQAVSRHEQRKKESSTSGDQDAEEGPAPESSGEHGTVADWNCDPNEPRYCLCNQVSYGEMVGCDNDKCPVEWFHYGCVGLAEAPKGKWYCPQCTQAMRRRKR